MKTELTEQQLEEVKAWRPEWFKPIFDIGKWYTDGECLFLFNGEYDEANDPKGYGFLTYNEKYNHWANEIDTGWNKNFKWREATAQEVEEALIKEAKKRGYKADVVTGYGTIKGDWGNEFNHIGLTLRCHNVLIFNSGKWTEILTPSSNIHTDIQALKDKYTDYNFTIIAEKK